MTENFRPTVLRNQARAELKGQWGNSVLACLVFFAILYAGMAFLQLLGFYPEVDPGQPSAVYQSWGYWGAMLYNLFFASVISIGALFVWFDVARGEKVELKTLFEPLKNYGRYLCGVLLLNLFVFLWSLLFIIPGLIKAISYSQTYFIMRDNPRIKANDAIDLSMKMMKGHKMDYFLLLLSFVGWYLLCLIAWAAGFSLGYSGAGLLVFAIGFLFLIPYIYTTIAKFYEEVKKSAV